MLVEALWEIVLPALEDILITDGCRESCKWLADGLTCLFLSDTCQAMGKGLEDFARALERFNEERWAKLIEMRADISLRWAEICEE